MPQFTSQSGAAAGKKSHRRRIDPEFKKAIQEKSAELIRELNVQKLNAKQQLQYLSIMMPYVLPKLRATEVSAVIETNVPEWVHNLDKYTEKEILAAMNQIPEDHEQDQ